MDLSIIPELWIFLKGNDYGVHFTDELLTKEALVVWRKSKFQTPTLFAVWLDNSGLGETRTG